MRPAVALREDGIPPTNTLRSGSRVSGKQAMHSEELNGQLRLASLDPLRDYHFNVRKRDGRIVSFDETRIYLAVESAFKAEAGLSPDTPLSQETQSLVLRLTEAAAGDCLRRAVRGETLEIELIQDCVERQLLASGQHAVARGFILYREQRRKARALRGDRTTEGRPQAQLSITLRDGSRDVLDPQRVRREIIRACKGLEGQCSWKAV